ncbi:MAG TPA: Flp family type IVb pilin [Gemmatimonadaceae bacterium]|nr:Flp family type IVb pilin [Gemmatimonadaceae bacterium]
MPTRCSTRSRRRCNARTLRRGHALDVERVPPPCESTTETTIWRSNMRRWRRPVLRFLAVQEGATMVEYALMLAFIAAVCVVAIGVLGSNLNGAFNTNGLANSL